MTSPDLIHALRGSRPTAPAALRLRIREIASRERAPSVLERARAHLRRATLVAVPAAAVLVVLSAGVIGLVRSGPSDLDRAVSVPALGEATPSGTPDATSVPPATGLDPGRAQRVGATLTLEVADAAAVSSAARSALELTRRLGGYVVGSSISIGEEGSAQLVLRVPVARVQEAIVGLSGLGRIVSQQVTVDDLQQQLDALRAQEAQLAARIARLRARLAAGGLDPEAEAALRARLQSLREEHAAVRGERRARESEARFATISVSVATPGALGLEPAPSRLERALDEAVNVLAWEAVVALAAVIVLAPLAVVFAAAWLGHRLYRRREADRLLASP